MFPECIECRGTKASCGINPCPLLEEVRKRLPNEESASLNEISGPSPPTLFVGRFGYPNVTAGPTASWAPDSENSSIVSGDPAELFGKPLEEVATRHSNLVSGRRKMAISSPRSPDSILESTQLLAMSSSMVDIEMDFERPVTIGGTPSFDSMSTPTGPSGGIVSAEVVGHASIPRKVDSIAGETDMLANEAM